MFLVLCLFVWIAGFEAMAMINPRERDSGNGTDAKDTALPPSYDTFVDSVFWMALLCYLSIEVLKRII